MVRNRKIEWWIFLCRRRRGEKHAAAAADAFAHTGATRLSHIAADRLVARLRLLAAVCANNNKQSAQISSGIL